MVTLPGPRRGRGGSTPSVLVGVAPYPPVDFGTPETPGDAAFAGVEELAREHLADLVRYLRHRFPTLADDAEDLAQDALIAVRDKIKDAPEPRGYLFKTAKNLARDLWTKRQRVALVTVPDEGLEEGDLRVYAATDPALAAAQVIDYHAFVKTLPKSERVVAFYQYECAMPPAEIAALVNVAVGTVKSWQNRIRQRAKQWYGDEERAVDAS